MIDVALLCGALLLLAVAFAAFTSWFANRPAARDELSDSADELAATRRRIEK